MSVSTTGIYKLLRDNKVIAELSMGGYDPNPDASFEDNNFYFKKHYSQIADEIFDVFGFRFNRDGKAGYLTGYGKKVFTFSTIPKTQEESGPDYIYDYYDHKCKCMIEFMTANNLKLETI